MLFFNRLYNYTMTTCYSYIRFSNQSQSEGNSLDRQTDKAAAYAAKKGLVLDTTLKMNDEGVSAFRGRNASEGALGAFIKAIDDKRVKPGSLLLVEDIDRLTRLPVMDALVVFQRIIGGGVTIVTLKDEVEYSLDKLKSDWTPLLPVLFEMARGFGESARKSELIGKAWRAKKVDARTKLKPLGHLAPSWLTFEKKSDEYEFGRYVENETRAKLVRRIFQMSVDGTGKMGIAIALNNEGIPPFGERGTGKWGGSSLQRLLANRAVLGEYQPYEGTGKDKKPSGKPIPGFYPAIVDQLLFDQAQEANRLRKATGFTKQSEGQFNVWQGIGKCARCGGPLHIRDKTYLICYRTRIGECDGKYIRLDSAENFYREILAKVNSLSLVQASSDELRHELLQAQQKLIGQETERDEYQFFLKQARSPATFKLLVEAEAACESTQAQIATIQKQLAQDTIVDKEDFFARLDLQSKAGRNRSNTLLKQIGVQVFIDAGVYQIVQNGTPLFDLHLRSGKIAVLPYTPELFEAYKRQDLVTLDGVMKYQKAKRKAAGIPEPVVSDDAPNDWDADQAEL